MNKYSIKAVISIVLTIVLEVLFAIFPANAYFFGGLSSGWTAELITLIKLFIPTFLVLYIILNMTFTTSMKRADAERFIVLVFQYLCTMILLWIGYNRVLKIYMNWIPDSFENSHFYLKYTIVLVVSMLPVLDLRKWTDTWNGTIGFLKPIGRGLATLVKAVCKGIYFLWEKLVYLLGKGKGVILSIAAILFCYIMTETYTSNLFYEVAVNHIIWNIILYTVIYVLIWTLIRSVKWASFIQIAFFLIFGIVNYFVISFRGTPVNFGDFTVITTALSVAGGFKYSIDRYFMEATVPAVLYLFLLLRIQSGGKTKAEDKKGRRKQCVRYVISTVVIYVVILGLGYAALSNGFMRKRIEAKGWNLYTQSKTNGYLLSFVADSTNGLMDAPEGYSLDTISEVLDAEDSFDFNSLDIDISLDAITEKDTDISDMEEPNIIVVMNESFSDLSILGDIETDIDYMPYIKSLTEDTIYGQLYVSPYGGNTVYSEYEFLTGNSMAFLPKGSIPYTQYIKSDIETPSLVSVLKNQATPYEAVAIHPYDKSGYNRVGVYNSYGFDDFITIDDFSDYTIYRKFIQDADSYKKIIETYENKEAGQPLFVFNITMQNHGGYADVSNITLNEPVHVTSYPVDEAVDEYLSLVKESDTAVKGLIDYFSKVDEPTIIVFFGDHQPQLTTAFYDSIYGTDSTNLSFEESMKKHIVPFFIWSNYEDYGGQYVEHISTNYLSALVTELAGLETTDYQEFLLEMYSEYPVLSSVATIDRTGNMQASSTSIEEDALLQKYQMIQYNCVFEDKKRLNQYFYPSE